jgi:hypothetical protein
MKKILFLILLIVVVGIAALILGRNAVVKMALVGGVRSAADVEVEMKGVHVGLGSTDFGVDELKLHNPSDYPDPIMMDIPEFYVDYVLMDILKGNIHLQEMRLHLKEFVVVKNQKGELNLNAFKSVQQKQAEPVKAEPASKTHLQIDVLKLKIGKVLFKDYSKGGEPVIKEYDINIDKEYQNITDPTALSKLILSEALVKTTIANLVNLDMGALTQGVESAAKSVTKEASKVGEKAVEEGAGLIKKLIPSGD